MISPLVKMRILVDNHAGESLASEHGLSFLIESDNKQIIFDTGQGPSLRHRQPDPEGGFQVMTERNVALQDLTPFPPTFQKPLSLFYGGLTLLYPVENAINCLR